MSYKNFGSLMSEEFHTYEGKYYNIGNLISVDPYCTVFTVNQQTEILDFISHIAAVRECEMESRIKKYLNRKESKRRPMGPQRSRRGFHD